MTKRKQVESILKELSEMKDELPSKKDNTIDIPKMLEHPKVKQALKELKELKVDGEWLFYNGFVPAGMLLGKYL